MQRIISAHMAMWITTFLFVALWTLVAPHFGVLCTIIVLALFALDDEDTPEIQRLENGEELFRKYIDPHVVQ